jgi:hypothetical protein
LNGVVTLLREGTSAGPRPSHVTFIVNDGVLTVRINNQYTSVATDRSLSMGRAGLATFHARADFDDVHVAATTEPVLLLAKVSRGVGVTSNPHDRGRRQRRQQMRLRSCSCRRPRAVALSPTGTPVENQEIISSNVSIHGSSRTGAWFSSGAMWMRRTYYVTVRGTNQIDIRKMVNGAIHGPASANYTSPPGVQRYRRA